MKVPFLCQNSSIIQKIYGSVCSRELSLFFLEPQWFVVYREHFMDGPRIKPCGTPRSQC